jgi:hypothetical protein
MSQDEILGALESNAETFAWQRSAPRIASWDILSRPFGTDPLSVAYPGLTSWATFSRPSGTELVNGER